MILNQTNITEEGNHTMTKTSDSDLIQAFIESQTEAKAALTTTIINKFGRDNFMQRAYFISNNEVEAVDLTNPQPNPFQAQEERLAFYADNHKDYMAWFSGVRAGSKSDTLNLLSIMLWGEDDASYEQIERVFLSNDSSNPNYDRFADILVIHSLEDISQSFEAFVIRYRDENEFFDINIELNANLSVEAKHLLLCNVPTMNVMDDGSIRDAIGVINEPHKTLEDIVRLIRMDGYKDGYLARSEEDEDPYEN